MKEKRATLLGDSDHPIMEVMGPFDQSIVQWDGSALIEYIDHFDEGSKSNNVDSCQVA